MFVTDIAAGIDVGELCSGILLAILVRRECTRVYAASNTADIRNKLACELRRLSSTAVDAVPRAAVFVVVDGDNAPVSWRTVSDKAGSTIDGTAVWFQELSVPS